MSEIGRAALLRHVSWLTLPEFKGRAPGTAQADSVASRVAALFRGLNLEPGAPEGGFLQSFPESVGVRVQGANGLRDNDHGYAFGGEWTPLGFSARGHALADLAFVGYGVSAPELGYDDYAKVDVRGKLVVAFLGEPGGTDVVSPFDGLAPTAHANLYAKAAAAREHGALGVIFTPAPATAAGGTGNRVWRISQEAGVVDAGILAAYVNLPAGEMLLKGLKESPADAQSRIDREYTPRSELLEGRRAELLVDLRRLPGHGTNVIAKLSPVDPPAGAILLLADLDGFGMGWDNARPEVHPGANDNVSGLAALLEIARVLPRVPRARTVYLAAVAGQALSGAGAEALALSLGDVHLDAVVAISAIGAPLKNRCFAVTESDVLQDMLRETNRTLLQPVDLEIRDEPSPEPLVAPFARRGIPTLYLTGGRGADSGTPNDKPERLIADGFEALARFAFALVSTGSR